MTVCDGTDGQISGRQTVAISLPMRRALKCHSIDMDSITISDTLQNILASSLALMIPDYFSVCRPTVAVWLTGSGNGVGTAMTKLLHVEPS